MAREGQGCPARFSDGTTLVVLPGEIDFSNAARCGEELTAALADGAGIVIADLSATGFCSSAGVRMLLRAYQEAAGRQAELRLVVTSRAVLRVLEIMDLDRMIPIYPDVRAAQAGEHGQRGQADADGSG